MCPVCPARARKINKHVRTKHLPWFFVPELACWICKRSFGCANDVRRHEEFCGKSSWSEGVWVGAALELLRRTAKALHVTVDQLPQLATGLPDPLAAHREELLIEVERAQGRRVQEVRVNPPNCPSAVLAVPVYVSLLEQMTAAQVGELKSLRIQDCEPTFPPTPKVVDAHVHLTQCDRRQPNWRQTGWQHVPEVSGITAVIDNRVFPGDWKKTENSEAFQVFHTFGIHLRVAAEGFDPASFEREAFARTHIAVG